MDFGRENSLFPLILIQVKSAAKRTVFGLKDKREKAFLPFKTQLFHIQVVRYADNDKYNAPIVVLVNEGNQSAAETSVQVIQCNPNTQTIGSQSAGANGNISKFTLPRGILGAFSGLGWYYPDGWVVNQQGVKIDHEIRPTLEGIRDGRDEMLEAALRLIEEKTEEE